MLALPRICQGLPFALPNFLSRKFWHEGLTSSWLILSWNNFDVVLECACIVIHNPVQTCAAKSKFEVVLVPRRMCSH